MRVFIGVDSRQPLAYTIARSSIERRSRKPIDIQPLRLDWMPMKRRGLTDFTFSRYLVPFLCGYNGEALFIDGDTLILDDIYKLRDEVAGTGILPEDGPDVHVVQGQLRFEWPSVMYFRNWQCKILTPDYIETGKPQKLDWANSVGELSKDWNHLVGYDPPNPTAKLIHFTQGIPCWPETKNCEYAEEWHEEFKQAIHTASFEELMGNSVHVQHMRMG